MENAIVNLSQFSFNANDVPINYQWSGYCKNSTEFKKYNFFETSCEDNTVYICSCDNGVALGDYLSNYIFCQPYMHDMENVLSPGYDYWFFQAWERAEPYFDELDEWVHDVVNHLMNNGYINRITCADMEFFYYFRNCEIRNTSIARTVGCRCRENMRNRFDKAL